MRRREFITLLGNVGALCPLAANAQQHEQMRRVDVLLGELEFSGASGRAEIAAFEEGLKQLGWTPGQNIDLDYHWPGAETARAVADEIAATHPDLVASHSTSATAAQTRAAHEYGVSYLRCAHGRYCPV
jgi:putative ABC transport system substrate-binding protein